MRRVALAEIGVRGSFAPHSRYAVAPEHTNRDPVADAFRAGMAEGESKAAAAAQAQLEELTASRQRIELAFARFDDESARLLQDRLHDAVAAICQAMAGEIAIEPDRLAARVKRAAAMLRRKHDERIVSLHPADLALVRGRLPASLRLEPDPSLARGQLRVDSEDGGVEDGPEQWRAALSEALGSCAP